MVYLIRDFLVEQKDLQIPLRKFLEPGENLNVIFDQDMENGKLENMDILNAEPGRINWRKVHVSAPWQVVASAMSSDDIALYLSWSKADQIS